MSDYLQQLQEEGWFVVRGLLDSQEIKQALDRLSHICHFPELLDDLPNVHPVSSPELADHANPLYHYDWIDHITFRDQELWKVVAAHPALLAVARAIVGDEVFLMNGGGCFMKPPGSPKGVPWHQDASPFADEPVDGSNGTPPLFDFWLGLTAATEEMGCLQIIPGSQHRGRLPHNPGPDKLHPDLDLQELGYHASDILSIPTEPGDLIVWHQDMIHGSQANRSTNSRIAVASIYHGRREEDLLRHEHRTGACRERPQFCDGKTILPCPQPLPIPMETIA